jgi:hypothetical protein
MSDRLIEAFMRCCELDDVFGTPQYRDDDGSSLFGSSGLVDSSSDNGLGGSVTGSSMSKPTGFVVANGSPIAKIGSDFVVYIIGALMFLVYV